MAFVKFEENRFRIDGEIAENHAILVNLTASIGPRPITVTVSHSDTGTATELNSLLPVLVSDLRLSLTTAHCHKN